MDWEVPSHAGSGPEGEVLPVAAPSGSGDAAAGQDLPPTETAAGDGTGDQDGPTSAPAAEPGFAADASGQPGAAADGSRARRSMFHRVGPGSADTDLADQRHARHSAARPHLSRPHLNGPRSARSHAAGPAIARPQLASLPLVSRPLVNARLAADPRVRIWAARTAIAVGVYLVFMLWRGWRFGLTIAALYAAADIIFRSKTTAAIPPSIRVTSAQRSTRRRLKVLEPAGYLALNACTIPGMQAGTRSVIDHVVIGPAGVFALDSERLDRRLPVRTIGGKLFHGPVNQDERLKHSRWEAHQVAALLSAKLGHPVKVHPVMIIYGPRIPWVVGKLQGVDVFDGGRVGTFFRRQSKATADRHLDASQIAAVCAAAVQVLPPLV